MDFMLPTLPHDLTAIEVKPVFKCHSSVRAFDHLEHWIRRSLDDLVDKRRQVLVLKGNNSRVRIAQLRNLLCFHDFDISQCPNDQHVSLCKQLHEC